MPQILLYIECEDYLRQWIIHESGGQEPVSLKKGSPESLFLEMALQRQPDGQQPIKPTESSLPIIIPEYRHKSPLYYNHLSTKARGALLKIFRSRFDLALWNDLARITHYFTRKDLLIESWMEAHGIEVNDKNTFTVIKRLRRLTDRLRAPARMRRLRTSGKSEEN